MFGKSSGVTPDFLLSEHGVPCKESIVIMKKIDYEILIYLHVLRYSKSIYAIFTVMYVCMYVCVCVCMCVCVCVCVCMCLLVR